MTRWARSGNSQKHKKMPGDATSWEELSGQVKNNLSEEHIRNKKHTSAGTSKGFTKFQIESPDKRKMLNLSTSNLNLTKPNTTYINKIEHSFEGLDNENNGMPMASMLSKKQMEKKGKFLRFSMSKKLQNDNWNRESNETQNQGVSKKFVRENSWNNSNVFNEYENRTFLKKHSVKALSTKKSYKESDVSASDASLSPEAQMGKYKVKNNVLKKKSDNQHQDTENVEILGNKYSNKTQNCSGSQEINQKQSHVQEYDLPDSAQQRKNSKVGVKIKRKKFQDTEGSGSQCFKEEEQHPFNQQPLDEGFSNMQNNRNDMSFLSETNSVAQMKGKKGKNKLLKKKLKKQKFANQRQDTEDVEMLQNTYSNERQVNCTDSQEIHQNHSHVQESNSVQLRKKFQDVERSGCQSFVREEQHFNQKPFEKAFLGMQSNRNGMSCFSDKNSEAQSKRKKGKNKLLKKKLKKEKLANQLQENKELELLENKYFSETKRNSTEQAEINQQNLHNVKESDSAESFEQKTKQIESAEVSISIGDNEKPLRSNENDLKNKKKNFYLKRMEMKRAEKGMLLLPSKVERKLYLIKKKLREKGLAPEVLKEIIRKERRIEELKFRKTFCTKVCFNCRQVGHIVSDCPVPSQNSKTGICFKCGSTEHNSFKCTKNVEGFPLADCFICKQQGHISRDCPQNKHGIYPKGGKCNMCGNVNHLRKDCPSLRKKTNEHTFAVHTIYEGTSVDAEVSKNTKEKIVKKEKPKIVKF